MERTKEIVKNCSKGIFTATEMKPQTLIYGIKGTAVGKFANSRPV